MKMTLITSHKSDKEELPKELLQNIQDWQNLNPTFHHQYFSDQAMSDWVSANMNSLCRDAFDSLKTGAGKADFFRIAFLSQEGGFWHDADIPAFSLNASRPNLDFLMQDNHLVLFRNQRYGGLRYTLIASSGQSYILKEFLDYMSTNILQHKNLGSKIKTITLTGPCALFSFLNKEKKFAFPKIDTQVKKDGEKIYYARDIQPPDHHSDCIPNYNNIIKDMGVAHHSEKNAI